MTDRVYVEEPIEDVPEEETMPVLAKKSLARAQKLLDNARAGIREAETHLKEAASTPLFGNGLAAAMKEAQEGADALDGRIAALKTRLSEHFRPELPRDVDRPTAMREES